MNGTLHIPTDAASVWVFDPTVVESYAEGDLQQFELSRIVGVKAGLFFAFSVGSDGIYRVRITDGPLTREEQDYAVAKLSLQAKCSSGALCIGGYGFQANAASGQTISLPTGSYQFDVYEILWWASPLWWRENHEAPPNAPPDFVLVASRLPNATSVYELPQDLRLETLYLPGIEPDPEFLFPSTTRRIGTEPGMLLTSTVVKVLSDPPTLRLRPCGPEGFSAELDDTTGLNWRDRVRFRVLEVDRENQVIRGTLVERL